MPTFEFAQIEPVGQCNLRCQMCAIQFRKDGPPHGPLAFMDFGLYCRLIDQMPGLKRLHLQGLGEPLMHPRFFAMVRYAAERGIEVSTNTNLTLLRGKRIHRCLSSGLHELHASLDGATAATYERIRVQSRFARVLDNLQALLRARAAAGLGLPLVRLVVVIMRQNLAELTALVELAHRLGIDAVFAQHLCHDFQESALPEHYLPMRHFVEQQTLLAEDDAIVEAHFDRARARARELGVDLRLPRVRPRAHGREIDGRSRCDWPWHGPYIAYTGQTMPCCMVSTPDRISLGDAAAAGVAAVWAGAAYEDFRAALASECPPEVCRACSVYHGVF